MKNKELHNLVKDSIKVPTESFTDDLMDKIIKQEEMAQTRNPRLLLLSAACFLILILSLFIDMPDIQYLSYTVRISPVITPILSILFLAYELQYLFDLKDFMARFNKQANLARVS